MPPLWAVVTALVKRFVRIAAALQPRRSDFLALGAKGIHYITLFIVALPREDFRDLARVIRGDFNDFRHAREEMSGKHDGAAAIAHCFFACMHSRLQAKDGSEGDAFGETDLEVEKLHCADSIAQNFSEKIYVVIRILHFSLKFRALSRAPTLICFI